LYQGKYNTSNKEIFAEVGLGENARFAVVLGRVFKFHPVFESIIVDLLLQLHNCRTCDDMWIVAFAEKVFDYNQLFIQRLTAIVKDRFSPMEADEETVLDILSRLKLIQYAGYYHDLSPYAKVAMDSYPYGGKFFSVF
jgi:hypothetical protein